MATFIGGAHVFTLSLFFRVPVEKYLLDVFELNISVFNEFMAEETGYLFFGNMLFMDKF